MATAEKAEVVAVLGVLFAGRFVLVALIAFVGFVAFALGGGLPSHEGGEQGAEEEHSTTAWCCAETTHHDDLQFWLQTWC